MWGLIHRGETQGFFYWYSLWHHEANSNVNVSQMEASQSLMSDSVWMLKYLQMSFAHGADLPWAVFKPSGLLLNVIVRCRNCTQMIRSEGHSVPLFMCSCIQKVAEKVYYNTQIKVQKSSFWPSQGALQQPKRFKNPLKDHLALRWAWTNYRRTPIFFIFSPAWKGLIGNALWRKAAFNGNWGVWGGVEYHEAHNQMVSGLNNTRSGI